ANDTNFTPDIFVRDLANQTTTLVSVNQAGTGPGNQSSEGTPRISADGRYVVFTSRAGDLVPNDTNGAEDVFLRDVVAGTTTLVSVDVTGAGSGSSASMNPELSDDGQWITFISDAGNLVANDTNNVRDVFVRDMQNSATTLVSVNSVGTGPGNNSSDSPRITPDGNFVVFTSQASNLVGDDTNGTTRDVFVRDLINGTTTLVSRNSAGTGSGSGNSSNPTISGNGQFVAFVSNASNLAANDTNGSTADVFVHDLLAGVTTLLSVNSDSSGSGNLSSSSPIITNDGAIVVFASHASNFVADDNNGSQDIFIRDLAAATTTVASAAFAPSASGSRISNSPEISADGRRITYLSTAGDLVAGDTNGQQDVFVFDALTETTSLVSVDTTGAASGNSASGNARISADGRYVAFTSNANNLVANDTNGSTQDVFVRDLESQTTTLISVRVDGLGSGSSTSSAPSISDDSRIVAFVSNASNLVENDTNGSTADVFIRNLVNNSTTLISSLPSQTASGNGSSASPTLSGNGRLVAFTSTASNLIEGDFNGKQDVFIAPVGFTLHWQGDVSSNWSDPANWLENLAPQNGDTLVFDTNTSGLTSTVSTNDLTGLMVNRITIFDDSSTSNFTLNGNAISLAGGISRDGSAGFPWHASNLSFSGITLTQPQTFQVSDGQIVINSPLDNAGFLLTADVASSSSGAITFVGDVSGSGGINKIGTGPGGLHLTGGPKNYSGLTTINQGSIRLINGATLGDLSAGTVIAANGSVFIDHATPILENFSVQGNGFQNSGTIRGKDGSILAGDVILTGNTRFQTLFSGEFVVSGTISDQGHGFGVDAHVSHGTTLTLAGQNVYSGPTSVTEFNGGSLRVGAVGAIPNESEVILGSAGAVLDLNHLTETIGSLSGSGSVTLNGGTLITGADGTSTTFSGSISGAGEVVKLGSGVFQLTGINTYTGVTTVNEGTLLVNGSLALGNTVVVETAGTLGGVGTMSGTVQAAAGGTIAPGLSSGVLHVGVAAENQLYAFGQGPEPPNQRNLFGTFDLLTGNFSTLVDHPIGTPFATSLATGPAGELYFTEHAGGTTLVPFGTLDSSGNKTYVGAGLDLGTDSNRVVQLLAAPDGELYGFNVESTGGSRSWGRIDTANGTFTTIGDLAAEFDMGAGLDKPVLSFTTSGELYTFGFIGSSTYKFGQLDLNTGAFTDVLNPAPHDFATSFAPAPQGDLYFVQHSGGTALVPFGVLDVETGESTLVGSGLDFGMDVNRAVHVSLAPHGALYAWNFDTSGGSRTWGQIDIVSGALTSTGDLAEVFSPASFGPPVIGWATPVPSIRFETGSKLALEINGTSPGVGYDQLLVTGTIELNGGTLDVDLGYVPQLGDRFTIISNDGVDPVVGTFADLPQGGFLHVGGHSFQIDYQAGEGSNDVELRKIVAPVISLASTDRTVHEAEGIISLTATLDQPLDVDTLVPVRIVAGTATEGLDYRLLTTQFAFRAGETTATFDIEIVDDLIFEGDESFTIALDASGGVVLGADTQNTITIVDDDPMPAVRFRTTYQRVEEGMTTTIDVSLTSASAGTITVPLLFQHVSAGSDDYTVTASEITIPAGHLHGSTTISIVDDTIAEGQELLMVQLGTPTGAVLSSQPGDPLSHLIIIPRNDAPSVSFASAFQQRNEDAGIVRVELRLSNPSVDEITVPFSVSGIATEADRSISPGGSITFAAGVTSEFIDITIVDDLINELDETVVLNLGDLTGRADVLPGSTLSHTLRIIDNDTPIVNFTQRSRTVWEDVGSTSYTVTLSRPSAVEITVPITVSGTGRLSSGYASRSGSAADFSTSTSSITFPVDSVTGLTPTSVTRTINIVNDTRTEPTERIVIGLKAPTGGAKLGGVTRHDVFIKDDDPLAAIARSTSAVIERNRTVSFTVHLSAPTKRSVTVPFSIAGTATRNKDYTISPTSSVTFAAGETSKKVTVVIKDDRLDEPHETITLKLKTPTGGAKLSSTKTSTITILDNDRPVSVSWNFSSRSVGEWATRPVPVTVQLNRLSGKNVLVPISFSGSATRNADYAVSGLDGKGRLLIKAGRPSATFHVRMKNDRIYEGNERIRMYIGSPTNAFAPSFFRRLRSITIVDDERPPQPPPKAKSVSSGSCTAANNNSGPVGPLAVDTNIDVSCVDLSSLSGSTFVGSSSPFPTTTSPLTLNIATQGLFEGTTAFYDANFNGVLDYLDLDGDGMQQEGEPGEPSTITALDGSFLIAIPEEFDRDGDGVFGPNEGRWVLAGGVDTSIDLPLRTYLTASQGHYVVTPLSTLAEILVRRFGQSLEDAELRVVESFGLEGINFAQSNPIQGAETQDEVATAQEAISVKLSNAVLQIADLFAGLNGAPPIALLGEIVYTDFAEKIHEPGSSMDLSLEEIIRDVITGVSVATGLSVHANPVDNEGIVSGAAAVIAAGNQAVDGLENTGDLPYVTEVIRVKKVMQAEAAPALHNVAAGTAAITDVVTQFTGANLAARIAAATVGMILPPSVAIGNGSIQEGDTGISMLELPVELTGDHPNHTVTVNYATMDDSATEGSDYTAVSGTLTWAPGDNSPRTIQIPIHGDTLFEPTERFRVVLGDAVNAMVRGAIGYGFILNDDALEYTTVAPSESTQSLVEIGLSEDEVMLIDNGELITQGEVVDPLQLTIQGLDDVDNKLM
ncbi:MAG TPA: Calx-beta domain-containing protein, partial [Pirellulaceae bacterium]|nr:Calx-beta domain-containing protein [Pirellulaceae bacterium]